MISEHLARLSCRMPSARTERKQAAILHTATKLFLERGYDAVSLDDIVAEVGGSKATLYSYYGDKEGLFAATVQSACQSKLAAFQALNVGDLDPEAGLTTLAKQFVRAISDPHGRSMFRAMIAEAERFPKLAAIFFDAGPKAAMQVFQLHFERWQEQGLLRSGDPEALAVQFIGLILGNFHMKSMLGLSEALTEQQISDWVASGVEVFLHGALPPLK